MATRSKTPALLGVLAILLVGAALLTRLEPGASQPNASELALEAEAREPLVKAGAGQGQGPTILVEPSAGPKPVASGAARVLVPLEIELALLQAGAPALATGVPPPGSGANARLKGALQAGGTVLTGSVTFLHGPNQDRVLTTDSNGTFGAADLYPGVAIVRVDTNRGWSSEREILLRSLSTTQLNVGFASGAMARVNGTVLDPEGEPLADALVRVDGSIGRTDPEGIFRFPRVSPGKVMAVVEAKGYARYQEFVGVARATTVPPDQLVFRLQPEATLEVSVVESLGHRGPAHLFLMPSGGRRTRGQGDYPWHLVNPVVIHPGVTARIEGLAPGTLTAMLFKAGAKAKPRRTSVRLYPGRVTAKELHLEPTDGLRGKVVFEGKPVSGVRLRLEAPNAASATMRMLGLRPTFGEELVLPQLPAGAQTITTGRDGAFHFTTWDEFEERYYLSAESTDGKLRASRVVGPGDTGLELELQPVPDDPGGLDLTFDGLGPSLPVSLRVNGVARELRTWAGGDAFEIDDLPPGLWRIEVTWSGQTVSRGQRLQVEPGDRAQLEIDLPAALTAGG